MPDGYNIDIDKVNLETGSGPEMETEKERAKATKEEKVTKEEKEMKEEKVQVQGRGQAGREEGSPGKAMIAMSGGVDSSVAAFLMKKAGYECLGVRMEL